MNETKTYNGWTNYETWNVALWMDNEQGSQEYWRDRANDYLLQSEADSVFTKEERATLELADDIKEQFNNMPDLGASCYTDLLNSAMSEVNWYEIAEGLIKEAQENN